VKMGDGKEPGGRLEPEMDKKANNITNNQVSD
jgi:hypothetical protein